MRGTCLPGVLGMACPVDGTVARTAPIAAGRARTCFSTNLPSHFGLPSKNRSRCCSKISRQRIPWRRITSSDASSHLSEAKTEPHVQEDKKLRQLLDRIRASVGFDSIPWSTDQTYEITGSHELWTLTGPWQLLWTTSGPFFERVHSTRTSAVWAHDGVLVWTSDPSGRCTQADLDDAEVAMLSSWIRSSYWLSDRGREDLTLTLLSPTQLKSIRGFRGLPSETVIRVRLKEGKVGACVVVQEGVWVPHSIWMEAYGTVELWELNQWQPLLAGKDIKFPAEVIRNCTAGGRQAHWASASSAWEETAANGVPAWQIPPDKWLQPPLATYPVTTVNPQPPVCVEASLGPGGHLLVRPLIDGQDVGPFLLDTGATGLVLLRHVAERLGMRSYGEVGVIGVNGPSVSSFCEGESLEWGPLRISRPSYVLIPDLNLGTDLPPLAGILGSDVFQHCIVEIDFRQPSVKLMSVDQYVPSTSAPSVWQEVKFMSGLPHIPALVREGKTGGSAVLVLLDTGAAGVDAIFHPRATEQMGFSGLKTQGSARLGGLGSDSTMREVGVSREVSVEVGGVSFEKINAVFMPPSSVGGVDLSEWSAGLICSSLLRNCVCIFDYSRRRVSLQRHAR